jgi:uncharacterized membrane protein
MDMDMALEIENHIQISAPARTVLRLATRVEDWPRILSHYRRVHVLALRPEGRIVEMSAVRRRVPIPVRWRAIQRVDAGESRVHYRHIGGVTRGMEVEWSMRPVDSGVAVTIVHRFAPPWPWPGSWIARHVVCGFFVHAIADSTLAGIRLAAERGVPLIDQQEEPAPDGRE